MGSRYGAMDLACSPFPHMHISTLLSPIFSLLAPLVALLYT